MVLMLGYWICIIGTKVSTTCLVDFTALPFSAVSAIACYSPRRVHQVHSCPTLVIPCTCCKRAGSVCAAFQSTANST
jgi:hypothetical protein